VFSLFPGIQERIVRDMLNIEGLHSIVMRSFGSGNAPEQPWLIDALRQATERGVIIVNISQCVEGQVAMQRYDAGYQLMSAGIISGLDSTVEAAITKHMYLHALYPNDHQLIRQLMTTSIAGEITTVHEA
jgi:L-asparaginase